MSLISLIVILLGLVLGFSSGSAPNSQPVHVKAVMSIAPTPIVIVRIVPLPFPGWYCAPLEGLRAASVSLSMGLLKWRDDAHYPAGLDLEPHIPETARNPSGRLREESRKASSLLGHPECFDHADSYRGLQDIRQNLKVEAALLLPYFPPDLGVHGSLRTNLR